MGWETCISHESVSIKFKRIWCKSPFTPITGILKYAPLQQPEVYIANSFDLVDNDGKINNEGTVEFLQSAVDAFVELVKKFK